MSGFKEAGLPGLDTERLGRRFLYFAEVSSTNTFLKENAKDLPDGTACAAAFQSGGKGRMGRDWHNMKNKGLMFSFLLHGFDLSAMGALPLVAGLGVSMAVERLSGLKAVLKWSNDVLYEDKKLCGILCESRIQSGTGFAVVGIGVNLLYTREELDSLDLAYATSLLIDTKNKYGELETAAAILNASEPLLDIYRREGFSALRNDYEKRCVTIGKRVSVISPSGGAIEAEATGVGDDGSLICSKDGGVFRVNAGEATIRGIENRE